MKLIRLGFVVLVLTGCFADATFDEKETWDEFDCKGNPLCEDHYEMQRRLNDEPGFKDQFEVIDVTEDESRDVEHDGTPNIVSKLIDSRTARSTKGNSECPVYTVEYLNNDTLLPRQRSLSPWKRIREVHRNRIPRELIVSMCLCDGCIDVDTGMENVEGMASKPITFERIVQVRKNNSTSTRFRKKLKKIAIGCRCDIQIGSRVPST